MSNNEMLIQKPFRRKHRLSSLEIIEEEMESETYSESSITKDSTIEASSRKIWSNFTPFQSSWNKRISKATSEGNIRRQFQLLENDYIELSESLRLEQLEKKTILIKVEKFEKECQDLKKQVEEYNQKLILERKNAEQIKTDYEVMLRVQNEAFKRREKELLEQIDMWKTNINSDGSKFTENDSQISIINTFEFEEMSEKLESFERQNEFLQNSKDGLELQNRVLYSILGNVLKSFTSLQLQYKSSKLKIEKLQGISPELKEQKTKTKEIFPAPCKRVNESQIHSESEEFQNYPNIFFNSSDTIEKQENNLDIKIEYLNDLIISNRINNEIPMKDVQMECNTMNLSDSEKINKSNENEKNKYECLPQKHEATQLDLMKKDQDMILQRNENLLKKIEKLNKEKQFQEIEQGKLINIIQEKEVIILDMRNERTSIENEKKGILEQITYLKEFTHTQITELKEICKIFLDNKCCIDGFSHYKENQQPEKEEGNLKNFNIDLYNPHELKGQIESSIQMLKQIMVELKDILIQSQQKNINLKKTISKINVEMQEIKKEYVKFKEIFFKEIPKQLKIFETDIFHQIKELYEPKIELFNKEIGDENLKMRTYRNELKESCPTNEKQKMTNEINYVDNKIRDDFVSFETVYSNSKNTKDDFNKQQKHEEDLKFNEITSKVTEMQNWNFNSMHEGNRGKTQKNTQDKYIEFANTGECKREHRWKQHRTRDYDKRRNIDLNTLGLETTESLANQKYPQMNS